MTQHPAVMIDPPAHPSGIFISGTTNLVRVVGAFLLALFLTIQSGSFAAAQSTPVASPVATGGVEAATAWLVTQQHESGGFLGFSGEPDVSLTIDAVLALASTADDDRADALERAEAYLTAEGEAFVQTGPGYAGKFVLAAAALGMDPNTFGAVDLVLGSIPDADDLDEGQIGYCGFGPFQHAVCTLALVAANAEIPAGFIDPLVASQLENGGWSFDGAPDAAMADSNTTAFVIQAMVAAGIDASDPVIQNALGYLASVIDPEQGGFAYDANTGLIADANSTAVVIQALIAVGEDPASDEWGRSSQALASFQNASGAFRYQHEFPDDNLYATVQAIPAIAGVALPIAPR